MSEDVDKAFDVVDGLKKSDEPKQEQQPEQPEPEQPAEEPAQPEEDVE